MLHDAERGLFHGAWSLRPLSLCALIIVLDQFSRHVYRNEVRPDENDVKALALSKLMLRRQWHLELPVPLAVFSLMPLRHTPTVPRLETVVREVERRAARLHSAQDLLQKFRRATVFRLDILRSKTSRKSDGVGRAKQGSETTMAGDAFDGILERKGFIGNLDTIDQHCLVRTMREFIREYAQDASAMGPQQQRHLARMVLVVSLSGGVDSMVIARILVHLRDELHAKIKKLEDTLGRQSQKRKKSKVSPEVMTSVEAITVVAIHINYGNRAESGREALFLRQWCASFDIDFHERRIDEVSRGKAPRDVYERRSRQIRFAFYRDVLKKYVGAAVVPAANATVTTMSDMTAAPSVAVPGPVHVQCPGIFFGHHQGDVQENVISNFFSRRATPLDLSGMAPTSIIDRVRILRPLLPHPKTSIFDFAHMHGVPYFKDTTPQWSTRGKLRQKLMPLLAEIYGDGYLGSLSALAEESNQLSALVGPLFVQFHAQVKRSRIACWFDCTEYVRQPVFFWKEVLREVCHSMGLSMIREKSIKQFLTWLQPSLNRHRRNEGKSASDKTSSSILSTNNSTSTSTNPSSTDGRRIDGRSADGSDVRDGLQPKPPKRRRIAGGNSKSSKAHIKPRNGWPALKKGHLSFLFNGVMYLFSPRFVPFDIQSCTQAQIKNYEACIKARNTFSVGSWVICVSDGPTFVNDFRVRTVHIGMDEMCSGSCQYSIYYRNGQTLTLGNVKGTAHPAGLLDAKFRKMFPFIKVRGKPDEGSGEFVHSVSVLVEFKT